MLALSILLHMNPASAQDPALEGITDIEQLSLVDLLDLETDVATFSALGAREAPAVLTRVGRDRIEASGARDLLDLLDKLVPGFQFGVDTWGVVSAGVRGNWAAEGKIAVIVDGVEYSDDLYNFVPFGNHFPAENIESIEVIRGPGSARYGGVAELAVVRVTTRISDADWTGLHTWGRAGASTELALSRADLGTEWAGAVGSDGRLGLGVRAGYGHRSNGTYTDFWGTELSMADSSVLAPLHASAHLEKGPLVVHAGADQMLIRHRTNFTRVIPTLKGADFGMYFVRASARIPVGETASIAPRAHYHHQLAWRNVLNTDPSSFLYTNIPSDEVEVGVDAAVRALDRVDVALGANGRYEVATVPSEQWDEGLYDFNGERTIDVALGSAYAEVVAPIPDVLTLTLGGRVDVHDLYGVSPAPRIALTRAWDRFHAKLLAARGYRTPGLEMLHTDPDLEPEFVWIFEAEGGVGIGDRIYATVNLFDVTLHDSHLYFYAYDPVADTDTEGYRNGPRTGSRGGELTVRATAGALDLDAHYALYDASGKNLVPRYTAPQAPGANLGFAQHKAGVQATARAGALRVTPGLTVIGPRHVYASTTGAANREVVATPTAVVADIALLWKDLAVDGVTLGLSAYDLLDARPGFPQPYDGVHAVLPDMGREVLLELHYER